MLYSDAVKFRQIFINLVSNACKFTHDGKITILATFNAEADELIYHVSDTGIGMSPEAMQNIFEAFVQADSDTARKYGGTGLGLSICKQFVEMMQGSLDLTSAPGAGTTFTVVLPINIRSQRKTDVIPTKNQQELGLIAPDAQLAATASSTSDAADGSALQASQSSATYMAPAVDVLLLSEQHESEALSQNLDESSYNLFHILDTTGLVGANTQRKYDFLFGYLNRNNQQAFNADWKNLLNMLDDIEDFDLPALLLCCDVSSQHSHPRYKIASELIQGFDPENRKRLTIPVRQTNPVARRGNALLIGFDTTKPNDKWVRAALIEELGQEAWYCDSLEAGQCSAQSVTQSAPDLIFISAAISNEQALAVLLTLSNTFLDEGDQQSNREASLIDVPGVFVINESASSGRCLDRVAIEIKLG
jgi:two-component sensor histidine kinase